MDFEPVDDSYPPDPLEPEFLTCREVPKSIGTTQGIHEGMIVYHDPDVCPHSGTGPRFVRWQIRDGRYQWIIIDDIENYR